MNEKKIAFYHCHTPLHIGSGTTLDVIDLPIQREAHTNFPVMPSSSIKGVIRAEYGLKKTGFPTNEDFPEKPEDCPSNIDENKCKEFFEIFGYGDKEGNIIFTDGKILLFPVKSVKGVFAWITCPLVLERFVRDIGESLNLTEEIKKINDNEAIAGKDILIGDENSNNNGSNEKYLVLEEISFKVSNNNTNILNNIISQLPNNLKNEIPANKVAIISNERFSYFVKNHTEVNARIRIDQTTGTVDKTTGGLWYEELVPAETVFYNLILSRTDEQKNLEKIQKFMNEKIFQFGGDETLGRGFTKVYVK